MRLLIDPESAMVVSVPTTHRVAPSSSSRGPRPVARTALPRPKQVTPEVTARSPHPLELQTISGHWQRALDAAQGALAAADGSLPASDLGHRRHELLRERQQTAEMLTHLANVTGARPMPWLSPVPVNTAMLGLPNHVRACVFDVEGVLTNGGALHAWAWGEVFDDLLVHLSEQTGWEFIPFDRIGDYRAFFDGRARLEGIHLFLESRGIRLPEGRSTTRPRRTPPMAWPSERERCSREVCVFAALPRSPEPFATSRRPNARASGVRWSRRAPAR